MRYAGIGSVVLGASMVAVGVALCAGATVAAGDAGPQPVLVTTRIALTADTLSSLAGHTTHVLYVWPEIRAFAATANSAQMAELITDPRVALVEPDRQVSLSDSGASASSPAPTRATAASSTSLTPQVPWNLDMSDTAGSGYDGTGVTVAVINSGLPQNWRDFLPDGSVDIEHAAGFGAEGGGADVVGPNGIRGVGGPIGLHPHGLAVSSVIVGFRSELGPISGAAPGARVLPVRVIDHNNSAWQSWLTAGVLYVAKLKTSGALPGPVVINFSIHADPASVLEDAIEYAIDHGVLFVTIAGNDGPAAGSITHPGSLPRAITAGMVGWVQEAGFDPAAWIFRDVPENDPAQVYVPGISGRESAPPASPSLIDVLAPGSGIYAANPVGPGFSDRRQVAFDANANFPVVGTSLAAPHVSGIVAQMLQKNPALTQAQAESILRATALPIAPDADGVVTPMTVPQTPFGPGSMFWGPWGANATGAGLARGTAAVAATPQ